MAKYESNINGENYIATPSQALREALAELKLQLRHFDAMISQYEEAIRVLEDRYLSQIFIPKDNKEEK
ncbi:hypothetical protein [Staphylococcus phage Baghdad]|nr:hypothetical protein [Staphylococcus phage Baghdad]